jgi:hypothetical protein
MSRRHAADGWKLMLLNFQMTANKQNNPEVLGRTNHLLSFHYILIIWYSTDLIENSVQ